ncbi:hypothetical protein G7072_00210 [Nocardioides sp. HDW12B]|uniref:hypothetical protein n=1 Tax=Nocardioides sp. HDW12B TaxID=2714939 RepID=UPI00140C50FD|nr:hypothetical protein [Nocardioides sp. HDW12B]QIK64966.1 hypothetical protein G7072_00210 [Nocardioides sp. HDW12B]
MSALLPVASHLGLDVHTDGDPVDPKLATGLLSVQDTFSQWWPSMFNMIKIIAPVMQSGPDEETRGTGCFFSGGVDSFFSVLKNRDRVSHLIFVVGFDIDPDDGVLVERATRSARDSAQALNKPLIEVRTNIAELSRGRIDWGFHHHGAALAAVGHALAEHLSEVIIPASYHQADLIPWGSHPAVDHLWSSSDLTFSHDGVEFTRPEKVAVIAESVVALDHLRVCWKNPGGAFNCGRCEKCLRTMINLKLVGALERCRTLPDELRVRDVARLEVGHGGDRFAYQNVRALRDHSGGWALSLALRVAMGRSRLHVAGSQIRQRFDRMRKAG